MKLYFGSRFDNEIEIKEFEVIKETEKRYYYENGYVDKDKINKWREIYSIISTDKNLLLSIIKNHYIEENEILENKIKNNNIIIENVYKMQLDV